MEIKIQTREVSEKFKIPEFNLDSFLAKIRTLQKKLKKQNLEELKVEVGQGFKEKVYIPKLEREIEITYFNIQVSGPSFFIEGFKLIAIISKRDEKIELSYSSPTFTLAHVENLPKNLTCERCQKNRHRVHFALLEEVATGKTVTLGKECADDFYDKNLVSKYLFTQTLMSLHEDEEFDDFHMPKGSFYYLVEHFLAHAIETYVQDGFHPKAENQNSSVERAKFLYSTGQPKAEHVAMARAFLDNPEPVIKHRALGNDGIRFNVKQAISEQYCEERYLSYLVLVPAAILKIDHQAELDKAEAKLDVGFFGSIDEKVELEISITDKRVQASDYHRGDDYTVYAVTNEGHKLVIPGNSFYPEIGAKITVKGTVKKHYTSHGKSFTKIIRVKTVKCELSMRFIASLADLLESTVINNRDEYYDLYYAINSMCSAHHCVTLAVSLKSYEELIESSNSSPFNDTGIHCTHSAFEFDVSDYLTVKKKERAPGIFGFVVTRESEKAGKK